MTLLTESDPEIGQLLAQELGEVEARFAMELLSDLPCVNDLVQHIERYRGKMLRPMLVLLSGLASAVGEQVLTEAHRVIATVVEMVHMATLVHDDILDEAVVRRNGATVNGLRGNETAVMLGDYLISHAYHLCSGLDDQRIARLIAQTTNTVCEGELLQLANRDNYDLGQETYFEVIRRKTGSLCGVCCRLGAVLHGREESLADTMHEYGEKLGMAFQIVDDLLDLLGDERTVGKTLGRDVQKGKLTLPLIHFMEFAGGEDRRRMLQLFGEPSDSEGAERQRLAKIRRMLEAGGSICHARSWAERLVASAKGGLAALAPSPGRTLLEEMAEAVLVRRF